MTLAFAPLLFLLHPPSLPVLSSFSTILYSHPLSSSSSSSPLPSRGAIVSFPVAVRAALHAHARARTNTRGEQARWMRGGPAAEGRTDGRTERVTAAAAGLTNISDQEED
ncbi:hypothetical protein INR49_028433 [Caranx melampygus]|nr:hypothetical protein INR49_028433 [Caranx melampygus]